MLSELINRLQIALRVKGDVQVRYVIDLIGDMNIPHANWDNINEAIHTKTKREQHGKENSISKD